MPDTSLQHSPIPTYSLTERDCRWALARTFMEHKGLDALLVLGDHEDAGPTPFSFDSGRQYSPFKTAFILRSPLLRLEYGQFEWSRIVCRVRDGDVGLDQRKRRHCPVAKVQQAAANQAHQPPVWRRCHTSTGRAP